MTGVADMQVNSAVDVAYDAQREGARSAPRHAARDDECAAPSPCVSPRGTLAVGALGAVALVFGTLGGFMQVGHTSSIMLLPAAESSIDRSSRQGERVEGKAMATSLNEAAFRLLPHATNRKMSGLAASGIPNVALNAYRVTEARMAAAEPSCHLSWTLLAGIGRVESDHGRFGGASLSSSGESTPHIIGPALDGTRWDRVLDTDRGTLDGDNKFDHAVGPMQFIPSTWAAYGADADSDGLTDPFNINDAALGAARYLCAAGGDLASAAGQRRAVRAYNNNDHYIALVLGTASQYAIGVSVAAPAHGATSGQLPPIPPSPVQPPVNPGPAPAVGSHRPQSATSGSATRQAPWVGINHAQSTHASSPAASAVPGAAAQPSIRELPATGGSRTSVPTSGTLGQAPAPGTITTALAPVFCSQNVLRVLSPLCTVKPDA